MYPILFSYGPLRIYTYGFFLALAFLCSMYMAGREAKRRGGQPEQIYDLSFYAIVAAIVGSRSLDVILKWDYSQLTRWKSSCYGKAAWLFKAVLFWVCLPSCFISSGIRWLYGLLWISWPWPHPWVNLSVDWVVFWPVVVTARSVIIPGPLPLIIQTP